MTHTTPWLVAAPADFRNQLKALEPDALLALQRLAKYDLDINQSVRLSAAVKTHHETLRASGQFSPFRLGIVSSHTTDYIADAFPAIGLRHSLLIDCLTSDFGQVAQTVLDPTSRFVGQVDAVLLALEARMLGLDRACLGEGAAQVAVDQAIASVRGLCEGVRNTVGAFCVITTLAPPADSLFGSWDDMVAGTQRDLIANFNRRLGPEVLKSGDALVDVAHLAAMVGLVNWHDARAWHNAKLPFALDYTNIYVEYVCRVLAAVRGKSKKCLVLDLDNTLWSGVIGDDGLEGIKLGNGNGVGEAHAELQRYALELRDRGIVLAVCSKNDEVNARLPFHSHPEMILKEGHIAVFIANWNDKASNLREIAATLNIGTDALLFLDDNPAERSIVRRELPEVAVPEIGEDASDYVAALARGGWFESISFSDEDRKRADYYQANSERKSAQASVTNMSDYLRSLDMIATILPFDPVGRSRISQLVNKSNQFNLTTKRYTEGDIAEFEADPGKFTLQIRLADKFGDNGMISVVIFDKGRDVWSCDTWLMSCRVLGRRVEEAVLNHVAAAAKAEGARTLRGVYLPTKKNGLVEKHFEKLGFSPAGTTENGGTLWELDLAVFMPLELPIQISHQAG